MQSIIRRKNSANRSNCSVHTEMPGADSQIPSNCAVRRAAIVERCISESVRPAREIKLDLAKRGLVVRDILAA